MIPKTIHMVNTINWFENPATNFQRAVTFYKDIFGIQIKEAEMFGLKMGFFPSDGNNVSGTIVQGEDYTPSTSSPLIYLNGGADLQVFLDKVEGSKCKAIVPNTLISPEMGYFGIFLDTEGNKMTVHSMH